MRRSLIPADIFEQVATSTGTRAVLEGFFRGHAGASKVLNFAPPGRPGGATSTCVP